MAHPLCQRFFTEPTQTLHKHYEILRAHFVDQRPLPDIAEQFGMNFYTVRDLVRRFHAQCQSNQLPPFLSNHAREDHESSRLLPYHDSQNYLPLLIAVP